MGRGIAAALAGVALLSGCASMRGGSVTPEGPFQECVAQSRLTAQGVYLTQQDIKTAAAARERGDAFLGTLGSQVNPITAARAGSGAGVFVGAANLVTFKTANYSSRAQGWYQQLNDADPYKAALLLAREDKSAFRVRGGALDDGRLAQNIGLLGLAERGVVSLAISDHACATQIFNIADRLNEEEIAKRGGTLEGYERVMLRNLRAMAYLLEGDARARNVAQSARDLQAAERAKYDAEIQQGLAQARSTPGAGAVTGRNSLFQQVQRLFDSDAEVRANALIADRITTPYVNPLADYLSAVVSEIEASKGVGRSDEWDLAANAWTNAAQLAPNSSFLRRAAEDARARQRGRPLTDQKIVHVLVGIGAAPYKQVGTIAAPVDNTTFPVMVPVMKPTPSALAGGFVHAGDERAPLQLVSDIEGMAIRHNQDERPAQLLSALARGFGVYTAKKACGEAVKDYGALARFAAEAACGVTAQSALTPPTDSWMALPKGYYAARLVVPASAREVTVTMFNASRRPVEAKTFALLPQDSTFVYVSAKDHDVFGASQARPFGEGGRAPAPESQVQARL